MKPRKLFLILVGALVVLCSCVAPREVNYLQDIRQGGTIPLNSKFEAVVSPYDELRISVIGFGVEKELAEPFNPFGNTTQGVNQQNGERQHPISDIRADACGGTNALAVARYHQEQAG